MDTRKKLGEAKYFLDLLPNFQEDENKFRYNLSAFLSAWRSVLDIMLYDFDEHFSLGFTREATINYTVFLAVATALKKTEAIRFVKWWRKKQDTLRKEPLWDKRVFSVHKWNVEIYQNIYALGTGSGSGTVTWVSVNVGTVAPTMGAIASTIWAVAPTKGVDVPQATAPANFWSFKDSNENLIDKCEEGYAKLVAIILEAETAFKVNL
jgi:hypothetical protein